MSAYQSVRESYDRAAQATEFYDTFYEIFLSKSDDIPGFFKETDFQAQKVHLRSSLKLMTRENLTDGKVRVVVDKIGKTHDRNGYAVAPHFYDLWLDSLCETLQQHDSQFTPELEGCWREHMLGAIAVIKALY